MERETLAGSIRRKVAEVQAEQAAAEAADGNVSALTPAAVADSRLASGSASRTLASRLKESSVTGTRSKLLVPVFTILVVLALILLFLSFSRTRIGL